MVLATIALGAVASTGLLAPTNSVTSATSVVATQPQPQQHHASPPPVPTVKELSAAARVYIIDIAPILGNISAFEILARLAARGHNASTRNLAHVTSAAYAMRPERPTGSSSVPKPSMKCDYHDPSCSLRAYIHEEVIVTQLRQSPHITNDPTAADFLLVPLPATLYYLYLRDIGKHRCPDCEALERKIDEFLSGGGAGAEVARRWNDHRGAGGAAEGSADLAARHRGARPAGEKAVGEVPRGCGRNTFVFMSLRCPSADGIALHNRGWERGIFSPVREPVSGIHLCVEPAEPPTSHPQPQRLRQQQQQQQQVGSLLPVSPTKSLGFHIISVPFYEWDERLTNTSSVLRVMGDSANEQVGDAASAAPFSSAASTSSTASTFSFASISSTASATALLPSSRPISIYFRGSVINGLRTSLAAAMTRRPGAQTARGSGCRRCVYSPVTTARFLVSGTEQHLNQMAHSEYCVAPRGEAASAKRVYDAIASGCIPVILADDFDWPFAGRLATPPDPTIAAAAALPPQLDPSLFSLHVNEFDAQVDAPRLFRALEAMPRPRTDALRRGLRAHWRRFRYGPTYARGEALDGIIAELTNRRDAMAAVGCERGHTVPERWDTGLDAALSSSASSSSSSITVATSSSASSSASSTAAAASAAARDLAALRRAAQQSYARRAALLRAGQSPPPAADEAARRAREEYNRRMLGSATVASRGEAGAAGADQSLPNGERPSTRRAPMSLQELEALAGFV